MTRSTVSTTSWALRVLGWMLGAASLLNLIKDYKLTELRGTLAAWLAAYDTLASSLFILLIGWSTHLLENTLPQERHIFILSVLFSAAASRAGYFHFAARRHRAIEHIRSNPKQYLSSRFQDEFMLEELAKHPERFLRNEVKHPALVALGSFLLAVGLALVAATCSRPSWSWYPSGVCLLFLVLMNGIFLDDGYINFPYPSTRQVWNEVLPVVALSLILILIHRLLNDA
jgi:hypothetical protein